jgi:methylated-DNA-[protein]-cysteine S-methyltransferase
MRSCTSGCPARPPSHRLWSSPLKLLISHILSPIGTVLLVSDGESLRALDFYDYEPRMHRLLRLHYGSYTLTPAQDSGLLGRSVQAYFEGDLAALDSVPVRTSGTAFQRLVWAALRLIPPGTTTTYGRLGEQIGRSNASRAVGLANAANPVAIVVPCHRVIGANANLTGYAGGLDRKKWLITHERQHASRHSRFKRFS